MLSPTALDPAKWMTAEGLGVRGRGAGATKRQHPTTHTLHVVVRTVPWSPQPLYEVTGRSTMKGRAACEIGTQL